MSINETTAGWYPDPHRRFELRYHDGGTWTDHVSSGGVQITDGDSSTAARPPASTAGPSSGPAPATLTGDKRRQMAYTAIGCGAAMVLAAFLPWASGTGGSVNGIGIRLGIVTLLCGAGIVGYGYNALHAPVVRYHPGALTAIIIGVTVASMATTGIEELNSATFGIGDVEPAIGLHITLFAPLIAIWPLVVFWKSYRRQLAGRRASAAGGTFTR